MFSQLGALFRTGLRQAGSQDAGAEKKAFKEKMREERNGDAEPFAEDALWVDSARVSLVSVKAFLISMLPKDDKTAEEPVGPSLESFGDMSAIFPAPDIKPNPPATPRLARAANAYAATANQDISHEAEEHILAHELPSVFSPEKIADSADDIRALIADVEILAAQGVHDLDIQSDMNFYEAVRDAVRLERGKTLSQET